MKRCLNPICGLPNDDLAKVCKFCKSKTFVHIEVVPYPSVPAAEVGLLPRQGTKTGSRPVLDTEIHAEIVEPVIQYYRQFTNNRPVITTIRPGQNSILIGEEVSLTAIANDPEGDVLQYEWASSGGEILGNGPDVVLKTRASDRRSVPYDVNVT